MRRRRRQRPDDITPGKLGYHPRDIGRNIITSPGDRWFELDVLSGGQWHPWAAPLPPHLATPAVAAKAQAMADKYNGLGQYGRGQRWQLRAQRAAL
jgi:poly(3-hydroxyalkanoate) synthetase